MHKLENIIDTLHLEDLRNEFHPSFFDENEGYNMLIIRLPVIDNTLNVKSIGFVFTADKSYMYDRERGFFEDMEDMFESPHHIIDKILDNLLKSFSKYQEIVVDMEVFLYGDKGKHDFMNRWLELKRDILRIEKVLQRASLTMNDMIKFYAESKNFPINSYVDLHEHIERTMRSAELQLSKLDYIYNFYTARTNERMNRMIYLLTMISAIFLPLNLVVGFFGMNTSGLPFSDGGEGTLKAAAIMFIILLATASILYLFKDRADKSE